MEGKAIVAVARQDRGAAHGENASQRYAPARLVTDIHYEITQCILRRFRIWRGIGRLQEGLLTIALGVQRHPVTADHLAGLGDAGWRLHP
ncbi:hypothetical protein D9M68_775740 [compost metagenome]